ncbi:golgin subfamily A member 4 isoform X3 [Thunnus thynnus]|uniref:golgin subfamily A member 4 isoform X3 n=1 Tax=Thunnus thynnus TaxID=8237 RepID=UPI003527E2C6
MAGGSPFIWIALLLFCVVQASDSRHVASIHDDGKTLIGHTGNPELDKIISSIPITLPEGIDPRNINVTSITVKTCVGVKEQLTLLNKQLQQATLHNNQLDNEAFGLRTEIRQLKLKLSTCSATASAITSSYKTQLQNKMKEILEKFDSDTSLILKIIAITREVNTLQKKIELASNSTESTIDITVLQRELQEKSHELNLKTEQIKRSHPNSVLILQILSLQNQIWDLEQAESRRGEASPQQSQRILALQVQLKTNIDELRGKGDADSAMLELVSVHSQITVIQRMITYHTEKSRTNAADFQRQWRQKVELLKKKILQLNRDENNSELTKEILELQSKVDHFRQLMLNTKTTTDSLLKELRVMLDAEKKKFSDLQRQLEETDFTQAQLIIKVINIMKDVRELQDDKLETPSRNQETTLQTVLQAKEREYARAQAEIKELQRKLQLKSEECSGLEERYEQVKTEFEQKIAELNRTGDSKVALILNVINLHDDLKALEDLISTTKDPDKVSELHRQLEEKQDELNSKTEEIEKLMANPKIILTIIELQNDIWDHQKKAANETTGDQRKELQNRVDGLISEINDKDDENTKLMLKIMTLQSQVEYLQRQLSEHQRSQTAQVTQLTNELTAKKKDLQKSVNELNEKNQKDAKLILTITDLHNQLRNLEKEKRDEAQTTSSTVARLREQLKAKEEEHSHDQAEIKALQSELNQTEVQCSSFEQKLKELQRNLALKSEECSGLEERYEQVKTEFEQKIAELNRTGDSKVALILNVINLHDDLKALEDLISTTKDPDKVSELHRQLEEKQDELNSKTEEIEKLMANPKIILTIIELQNDIWDHQKKAANETTGDQRKELQNRVDGLISEIDDKDDENTKLMLKIMTLQSQVEYLQRQLSEHQRSQTAQVTQLTNELTAKKRDLQKSVNELNEKNQKDAKLILTITDLHNQLRNLEKEKRDEAQTTSSTVAKLREKLKAKEEEHSHDEAEIKALQSKLNQTEEQCYSFEQKLKELQNDLDDKMKELQSKSDSVTSLALQVSTLTLQLEELKRQLQNTESKTKIKELQKIIDEKNDELAKKTEELKARSAQPQKLLQIIAIQTEIEKLANVAENDTDYSKISVLQNHLNNLINGIEDEKDENTKLMFQILAQQDEIARLKKQEDKQTKAQLEKIKELENELEDVRNQIKEKTTVLDSSGTKLGDLSAQIMELHKKIKPLEDQISDLKETNAENLAEIQKRLELAKRQLQDSELRLNDADAQNFNLMMEIAELRAQLKKAEKGPSKAAERNINELTQQLQTQQKENKKLQSTNEGLREKLKAKEEEHSHDQAEIKALQSELNQTEVQFSGFEQKLKELQRNLALKSEECSGLEERYEQVKTEFEQKIAELNRTGDSKVALILNVINLHDDLKALEDLISTTKDPDKVSELHRQLEEKQDELNSKTEEIEKLMANPKIILTIIELQNDIWDHQKKAANETTGDQRKELQNRVDGLISEIDDKDDENTKLMLKIMTLQSQVEYLQRQLSEHQRSQTAQVTQLTNELTAKKRDLQKSVNELNEKNQKDAKLILTITDLHNQLRNLEKEKRDEAQTTSSTVAKLREKLKAKEEEHSHDQAEIKALQSKLNQTEEQCYSFEQKLKELQNDLDDKMKELQSKSDSVTSLALQVSTLTLQLEELKRQLQNTESKTKIKELQKIIDEKNDELAKKTEELKARSAQPQKLLQIIAIQTEIEKLANVAENDTDYSKISVLQNHLNNLINGIEDEKDENTKLMFQILAQQDEIARLKKQEDKQTKAQLEKIKELENELEDVRNQIKEKTTVLDSSGTKLGDLSAQIMELHKKIKPLEDQISDLKETNAENLAEIQKRLELAKRQLQDSELRLNDADAQNFNLMMEIAELRAQLKKAEKGPSKAAERNINELTQQLQTQQKENKKLQSTNEGLREKLKAKEEEHSHDQAEIKALQSKLNQTEEQCYSFEQKLKELQNDLDDKMKELQSKSDSVTSLALQISTLTLQLEELKRQLQNTESKTKMKELQKIIDEKNDELAKKTEELKARSAQPQKLLQIIAIQTEIEKLANVAENDTDYSKISVLQNHLNNLINGIEDEKDENTKLMFQILAQQDEIARLKKQEDKQTKAQLEKIKELENELEDVRNQIKEKTTVLDSSDTKIGDLSAQIMELHKKIKPLEDQISDLKETNAENLAEIQKRLELAKRQLQDSELRLNDADAQNFNLMMEIAELRAQLKKAEKGPSKAAERNINELTQQLQTQQKENKKLQSTNEGLREQLKAKEEEHSHDQAEIKALQSELNQTEVQFSGFEQKVKELQRNLTLKSEECSGLEERYEQVKTEFEQKIAELNRTGDSKVALILNVINLHDDVKALEDLISTTKDPDKVSELQRQLEEKQDELNSKTEEIEKLMANPKIILTIIELQNDIWDHQKKAANETTGDQIKELQNRVDGLISEIDDKDDENTKLMLKIMTLQSQVEYLQRQLSEHQRSQTAQVTQLTNELTAKKRDLQKSVNELNEKNQKDAKLILTITDLHNQLRNLEKEKRNEAQTTSSTVAKLREKLKAKEEEHSHDQAEIKALQSKLNQTEEQCYSFEQKLKELQNDLDDKMKELQSKSDSVTSLALQISTLTLQLEELKRQLQNTESKTKIKELQKIIDEKNDELAKKTEELKARSAQPYRLLQIIAIQTEIEKLANVAENDTDYFKISALQNHLNNLIKGIQDEKDENTKLMFQILAQQDEIARLKKQEDKQTKAQLEKIKELENELEDVRNQIKEKTTVLDSSDTKIGDLSAQIMELQKKIKPLEDQISDLKETNAENLAEIQKRLELAKRQLQDSELRLNDADAQNFNLMMEIAELRAQLKKAEKGPSKAAERNINELTQQLQTQQKENKKLQSTNEGLREQLKAKEEEHSHDQAEIKALQSELNQTEAQCSSFEQKLKELQNDLDDKMKELQSKSDSVTSLALQISTLTLQLEELKRQLQNTESKTKIKELQKIIDEKNDELAKKTEELKARSAQPQKLLQIIAIQTEIEKLANVAENDTDYSKISALQNHLNNLINGIEDEKDENTKLMFQILAQQDEIARLKKQEDKQTKAQLEKIKELENELEDVRNQIKEKTTVLDSSDMKIGDLSAQIMELHKKIKPLEDQISDLKETNAENLAEIQKRLELAKRQLQDSELRLNDADAQNFNLMMEIAELRAQLKKAEKGPSKAAERNINELTQQLQTQQKENKKLQSTNEDLKQEAKELKMCCNNAVTHCEDLQRELEQSQKDTDRLQLQLNDKDAELQQLQLELAEERTVNNRLQNEYDNLRSQQEQTQDNADHLQQLHIKDIKITQLQQQLEELQNKYRNLDNEKNKLTDIITELQKNSNEEDKTIYTRQVTLDPNTAHRRLALSDHNTQIHADDDDQDVPDNPGRFDVVLAALGSTGFSTGRHYWEVSVAEANCYLLGMASESSQRKGTLSFKPLKGYWTIVLNKQGQYKAMNNRPITLQVQTPPLMLGILLDYNKGQISFYDAGTRSHLYSFVGQKFTGKIYPFVNICLEDVTLQNPIILIPPGPTDWII